MSKSRHELDDNWKGIKIYRRLQSRIGTVVKVDWELNWTPGDSSLITIGDRKLEI